MCVRVHARRQRHAVAHTGKQHRANLASSRATPPRLTYIRYDTSEPQGRQVAHKTKETLEKSGGEQDSDEENE